MEEQVDNVTPEGVKYETLQVYEGTYFKTLLTRKYRERKPYAAPDASVIKSFIPGTIRNIYVTEGQKVSKGDQLLTLEAMKMLNELCAPFNGVVKKLHVKVGQVVANKEVMIELAAAGKGKVKDKVKDKNKDKAGSKPKAKK